MVNVVVIELTIHHPLVLLSKNNKIKRKIILINMN